jgi:hypothetical protein
LRQQSTYDEQLLGSIRRERSDRIIVINRPQLQQILLAYFACYHRHRFHRSLDHDNPLTRPVESSDGGKSIEFPLVDDLPSSSPASGSLKETGVIAPAGARPNRAFVSYRFCTWSES